MNIYPGEWLSKWKLTLVEEYIPRQTFILADTTWISTAFPDYAWFMYSFSLCVIRTCFYVRGKRVKLVIGHPCRCLKFKRIFFQKILQYLTLKKKMICWTSSIFKNIDIRIFDIRKNCYISIYIYHFIDFYNKIWRAHAFRLLFYRNTLIIDRYQHYKWALFSFINTPSKAILKTLSSNWNKNWLI